MAFPRPIQVPASLQVQVPERVFLQEREPERVPGEDGDVVVFGGPARRGYHRVRPVRADAGVLQHRVNLTFRRAR